MIRLILAGFFLVTGLTSLRADDDFREFLGHTGPTRAGIFTPDGSLLVTCSGWPAGDGTVRVFDVKTAKELRVMKGHKAGIDAMAMSPDGKFVYSGGGGGEGAVRVWDVATGKEVVKFHEPIKGENTSCVIVAPNGKSVVSGGSGKIAYQWEADTGKLIRKFEGHTDLVRCLAFTSDGKTLLTGSWDGTVKVWDVSNGKELRTFKPKTKWVYGLSMLPDGKSVAVAGDETAIWNHETGERVKRITGGSTCLTTSVDGKKMLTGFYDGKVSLYDIESGKREAEFQAHVGHVHGLSFSADGKWFSTCGGGNYKDGKEIKGTDFAVRVWKVEE